MTHLYMLVFVVLPNLSYEVPNDCLPIPIEKAVARIEEEAKFTADVYEATCQKREGMYQWDCVNPRGVIHVSLQKDLKECKATPFRIVNNIRNMMKKPTL